MDAALPVGSLDRQTRFRLWRDEHVPLLYDWLSSRQLIWPHAALCWGALATEDIAARERGTHTAAAASLSAAFSTRALYLAERTGASERDPNTLLHFDVRVVQELTCKPHEVARPWQDEAVVKDRADKMSTLDFWLRKRIVHPGEVNRICFAGPGVVVTHTDSEQLFVWDFERQPHRAKDDTTPSVPTCTLVGHHALAEFAMDVARPPGVADAADAGASAAAAAAAAAPTDDTWVVSGGRDCCVLVWKLGDYQAAGTSVPPFAKMEGRKDGSPLQGHTAGVEDVSFNASDRNVVVSVGTDSHMMLWDVRHPARPSSVVQTAHDGDVNCCDFGGTNTYLIATGGSDSIVRVWDRRFMKNSRGENQPLRALRGHTGEVTSVVWNRYVPDVLASGAEDAHVLVWRVCDTDRRPPAVVERTYPKSAELMFKHVGHAGSPAKIVDLEWLPSEADPYCIASLSETLGEGGSTLQIWRMTDLIYRPATEVAAEIRQHTRQKNQK